MADDGMDPCECFWSHEIAMRRLLSLLRQSQTVCSDTECFDEISGPSSLPNAPENNLMMMFMLMAFAVIMVLLRPRSVRSKSDAGYRKNEGDDGRPPMPPAVN